MEEKYVKNDIVFTKTESKNQKYKQLICISKNTSVITINEGKETTITFTNPFLHKQKENEMSFLLKRLTKMISTTNVDVKIVYFDEAKDDLIFFMFCFFEMLFTFGYIEEAIKIRNEKNLVIKYKNEVLYECGYINL